MVPKLVLCAMIQQTNSNERVEVSVVFPAYNEVNYLDSSSAENHSSSK